MTFYEQPFYDDDVIMTSQGRFQIFLTPPVHVPYFNLSTLKVSKLYLKKCRSRPLHQFVGYIYHYLSIYQSQNRKGCKADPLLKSQGSRHSPRWLFFSKKIFKNILKVVFYTF